MGGDLQSLKPIVEDRFELRRREILYRAGTRQSSIYVVRSGSVKTSHADADGEEQVLDFYLPGDVIGLNDLSTGVHRATAVALEGTWICSLPAKQLFSGDDTGSPIIREMFLIVCRQLAQQHRIIRQMRKANVTDRLAWFLLDLSERLQNRRLPGDQFRLSMDRIDIANHLRSTLESVSRSFSTLHSEGLIDVRRKSVVILRAEGLRARFGDAETTCDRVEADFPGFPDS